MRTPALLLATVLATTAATAAPNPGTRARYRVLPADKHQAPPLEVVHFTYTPRDSRPSGDGVGWQLTTYRKLEDETNASPLFELRCVTEEDPLGAPPGAPRQFISYQLRIPATGEEFDYRSVHTDRAILPLWHDFERYFIPRPARGTLRQQSFPNTCAYLGHVLTLDRVERDASWARWENCRVLRLDDELLIGTGRVFKDSEGHRLPQRPEKQNYSYVQFTQKDYETMIKAGLNTFALVPGVESYVRSQPAFYRRGLSGDLPLSYPVDFYRSNYRGTLMYEDEPACIMIGDPNVHRTLRYFSDATELLQKRVRARYDRKAHALEKSLRDIGTSFGDMRLAQLDYAVWETRFETAFYQLSAGFAGIVHEGRYRLDDFYESGASFDEYVRVSTGLERKHTAKEMLRYYYAFLRGAARHFDKYWGTSIYGQADPQISPLAVKLAYDMGARYVWFWTSDHGHHLPWNEQLELTRILKNHARENPRPSIHGARRVLDKAIVIPYGYLPVLESPSGRRNPWDLWWVRELDRDGKNEASQRFRHRMRELLVEVHRAFDSGEDFDITVDDGREIRGYRQVVRLKVR